MSQWWVTKLVSIRSTVEGTGLIASAMRRNEHSTRKCAGVFSVTVLCSGMRQQRAAWTMDISSCVQRQEEFVTTGQPIRGSAAGVLSLVISAVKSSIVVACIIFSCFNSISRL